MRSDDVLGPAREHLAAIQAQTERLRKLKADVDAFVTSNQAVSTDLTTAAGQELQWGWSQLRALVAGERSQADRIRFLGISPNIEHATEDGLRAEAFALAAQIADAQEGLKDADWQLESKSQFADERKLHRRGGTLKTADGCFGMALVMLLLAGLALVVAIRYRRA